MGTDRLDTSSLGSILGLTGQQAAGILTDGAAGVPSPQYLLGSSSILYKVRLLQARAIPHLCWRDFSPNVRSPSRLADGMVK